MRLLKELHAQIWTVCGTLLVLYTLTGQTRTFVISMVLHLIGTTMTKEGEDDE